MRHAVDLDEQVGVLHRGQRPVGAPAEAQPALVLGELLDAGLDRGAVDLDAVAVGAGLPDREAVAGAAVEQVERVADVGLRLRAAAAGERVEVGAVGGRLLVAQGDRRLHERRVGVAHGLDVALRLQAVEPAGVDLAGAQLGPAQQLEQEALVGRALVDHHHRVGHRAAQARDRLLARGAVGDDLGQHRVEVSGHGVALGEAGVDADAGAGRQPQQADPPGGGGEAARRVLCVQADLDRMAPRRRRIALEAAAGGDVQLERDEVGAGHDLGHGVLDLQPGVDLHEGELLRLGLVEELDGGGAAVADLAGELGRRLRQLARLLVAEDRAGRLLHDLLVAPLVGAVAHAERPHGALPVGQELDLDVARRLDQALHQHRVVAEGLAGLGAGALVGVGDLVLLLHAPHAAPAAARGRLDHQREAELGGDPLGVLDAVDRPAAPRRHRHAGLLGELLGLDLVAELAHHLGVRAREDDAEPVAQLGEGRVLGDEAPADPGGVGASSRSARARAPRSRDRRRRGRCSSARRPDARTAHDARSRCRARSPGSAPRASR